MSSLVNDLLLRLPAKWSPVVDSHGRYLHSESSIWVLCPRGHHVKTYFAVISSPVCLACAEKRDVKLRNSLEKLFEEPFSKRVPTEGFMNVHMRIGFTHRIPKDCHLVSAWPSQSYFITSGVIWIVIKKSRSAKVLRGVIMGVLTKWINSQNLPALNVKFVEKIKAAHSERRARAEQLKPQRDTAPISLTKNKYTGGLIDMSELMFESAHGV